MLRIAAIHNEEICLENVILTDYIKRARNITNELVSINGRTGSLMYSKETNIP